MLEWPQVLAPGVLAANIASTKDLTNRDLPMEEM